MRLNGEVMVGKKIPAIYRSEIVVLTPVVFGGIGSIVLFMIAEILTIVYAWGSVMVSYSDGGGWFALLSPLLATAYSFKIALGGSIPAVIAAMINILTLFKDDARLYMNEGKRVGLIILSLIFLIISAFLMVRFFWWLPDTIATIDRII